MITKYSYWAWEKALTPEQCQDIKNLGDSALKESKDTRGRIDQKGVVDKAWRVCDTAWLGYDWIYDMLHPYTAMANEGAGWNYEWDFSELVQYTVYDEGGFYGWHTDQGMSCSAGAYNYSKEVNVEGTAITTAPCIVSNPIDNPNLAGKIRKLSMTVNLDEPDDYEGGDLEFDFGNIYQTNNPRFQTMTKIRPQGSLVVFPSYTYHQVQKVTKGKRHSLVMWSCGEPYKQGIS